MANRSKKVVLSARVDPYLKAALELLATSKNQKIVKLLEMFIEEGMDNTKIENPLKYDGKKVDYMMVFQSIWTEDEVIYKLRAGALGSKFAGDELAKIATRVVDNNYFNGDYELFGDLNGMASKYGFAPPYPWKINIDLVKAEWDILNQYVSFLESNKPFSPSYDEYKNILAKSDSK